MSAPTVEEALARITAAMDAAPGMLSIIRVGPSYRGKLDVGRSGTSQSCRSVTAEGDTAAAVLIRLGYLCDPPA